MITHRAIRDVKRCRAKYGRAWEEYETRVPYLFIPVSFFPFFSFGGLVWAAQFRWADLFYPVGYQRRGEVWL